MTQLIDLETPCFYIEFCWVSKSDFDKYGEDSKRTHYSRVSWYYDGPENKALAGYYDWLARAMERGDIVFRKECSPVTGYYLKIRREPARHSVIANWGSCDLRSF